MVIICTCYFYNRYNIKSFKLKSSQTYTKAKKWRKIKMGWSKYFSNEANANIHFVLGFVLGAVVMIGIVGWIIGI